MLRCHVLFPLLVVVALAGCASTPDAAAPETAAGAAPQLADAAGAAQANAAQQAERDMQEARFVELTRRGLLGPPPQNEAEMKAMQAELQGLMLTLAGVDPAHPSDDAGVRVAATQAEILARRDPALRDELLRQMKRFQCRSKQSEAKAGLKSLSVMQLYFKEEHKTFARDIAELGVDEVLKPQRYSYSIGSADAKTYKAKATGQDDMAGDVWELTHGGDAVNTANACAALDATP